MAHISWLLDYGLAFLQIYFSYVFSPKSRACDISLLYLMQ
jgi:hypothetical protein